MTAHWSLVSVTQSLAPHAAFCLLQLPRRCCGICRDIRQYLLRAVRTTSERRKAKSLPNLRIRDKRSTPPPPLSGSFVSLQPCHHVHAFAKSKSSSYRQRVVYNLEASWTSKQVFKKERERERDDDDDDGDDDERRIVYCVV